MLLSLVVRQRMVMLVKKEHYAPLEVVTEMIEAGKLAPVVDKIYPVDEAPAAMGCLEAGHARGKIAVTI